MNSINFPRVRLKNTLFTLFRFVPTLVLVLGGSISLAETVPSGTTAVSSAGSYSNGTAGSRSFERRSRDNRYDNDGWILQAGLGSPMGLNLVGITRDYKKLSDHTSLFFAGGLGLTVIGTGILYTSNQDNTGFLADVTLGLPVTHAAIGYRWQLHHNGYLTAGIAYGTLFWFRGEWAPVVSFEFPVDLKRFLAPVG